MAIFQTFFAIGIFFGDYVYKMILQVIGNVGELQIYRSVFWFIMILSVLLLLLTMFGIRFKEEDGGYELNHNV